MATSRSKTERPALLVANRGEIALRVIRGARDAGWRTIAVYSEADAVAPFVQIADEAYPIGPAPSHQSYLRIETILEAARRAGATHLHPGYGFLAENGDFAEACAAAGIGFVGPPAGAIREMGDKVSARKYAEAAGVPLIPGSPPLPDDPKEARRWAERIGYPVLIKAAFGGGGKGMRLCRDPEELTHALALTRGEAGRAFGNDTIYLERGLIRPRHIEVQILCDLHGHGIYLGERECSIQRRHQKLIEETPAVVVAPELRRRMGEAAVDLALEIGYQNAGTVEFLFDESGDFYFLEMNTRLQVEHPITEAVTGIDLLRAQLEIAQGVPLRWTQEEIHPSGAAIECRIVAEDPGAGFVPVSGPIRWVRLPEGPGVRNDFGFETGGEVPVHYDSMLGKLIVWGSDREEARRRALGALAEYRIEGVQTNLPFLRWALGHPEFVAGRTHTGFIEDHFAPEALGDAAPIEDLSILGAVAAFRRRNRPGRAAVGTGDEPRPGRTDRSNPQAPRITAWKRFGRWNRR